MMSQDEELLAIGVQHLMMGDATASAKLVAYVNQTIDLRTRHVIIFDTVMDAWEAAAQAWTEVDLVT